MVTRIQSEADSPALSAAARAFRTILTHVSADPQEAPRLRAAAALARKLDSTLFGVACETIPPATAADPTGLAVTQWMVAMQDVTRANLERAHQLFLGEAEGLKSDWLALETLILDVCHEAEAADADARTAAVVESLARHGVAARARTVVAPGHRGAAELNAAAGEIGADLIVAGGYGHSRLGEWVFGGVTYDLLHAQERFLLLSH